jgi:hypothetical protein
VYCNYILLTDVFSFIKYSFTMSEQFVHITTFNFPTDPEFVVFIAALEHAGIPYLCPERTQLENQSLLSIGLGGLRVLVPARYADQAQALLEEQRTSTEPETPDAADLEIARLRAEEAQAAQQGYRALKFMAWIAVFLAVVGAIMWWGRR